MTKTEPVPEDMFAPSRRCMVVLAHQDDELTFAGIVQRLPPDTRFLWITNGDGLSDQIGMPEAEYAEKRRLETVRAMGLAGISEDRLQFLGHSEKAIYARIASLDDRHPEFQRAAVFSYFKDIAARVSAEIAACRPDLIITQAWQGGHPEHDLTHLMTVRAAAGLPRCEVWEVPEYELMYSVFLRFPPWRRGPVHEILLNADEMRIKQDMLECYDSQKRGMFLSRLMILAGDVVEKSIGLITTRRLPGTSFAAREQIAPVPGDRDYRKPPHGLDQLEYIGDDWHKRPISFSRMITPIVCALEQ